MIWQLFLEAGKYLKKFSLKIFLKSQTKFEVKKYFELKIY